MNDTKLEGRCEMCGRHTETEVVMDHRMISPSQAGSIAVHYCRFCIESGLSDVKLNEHVNTNVVRLAKAIGYLGSKLAETGKIIL